MPHTNANPAGGDRGARQAICSDNSKPAENSHSIDQKQASRGLAREVCILGVDPGLSGALAFYFLASPSHIVAEDIPVVAGEIDAATLAQRIAQMRPTVAFLERVGAMPKQGVSSTFKFGCAFGIVRGVLATLAIPIHLVAPTVWKKHFRLPADKEAARARALSFWPAAGCFSRKKDHGRAEAALLAVYGASQAHGDKTEGVQR